MSSAGGTSPCLSRKPPSDVRKQLQEEVGYGCPVPGCGSPYLEWHHFDPPWHKVKHHNPAGMIALCRDHHPEADGGAFTIDQLRQFKADGKKNSAAVFGKFNWLRNDLVTIVGNTVAVRTYTFVQLGDVPMICLRRDEHGMLLLNVAFISKTNTQPVIEDNYWQGNVGSIEKLICPPSGKLLELRYTTGEYVRTEYHEIEDEVTAKKAYPTYHVETWKVKYPITVLELDYRSDDGRYDFKPNSLKAPGVIMTPGSRGISIDCGILFHYPNVEWNFYFGSPGTPSDTPAN